MEFWLTHWDFSILTLLLMIPFFWLFYISWEIYGKKHAPITSSLYPIIMMLYVCYAYFNKVKKPILLFFTIILLMIALMTYRSIPQTVSIEELTNDKALYGGPYPEIILSKHTKAYNKSIDVEESHKHGLSETTFDYRYYPITSENTEIKTSKYIFSRDSLLEKLTGKKDILVTENISSKKLSGTIWKPELNLILKLNKKFPHINTSNTIIIKPSKPDKYILVKYIASLVIFAFAIFIFTRFLNLYKAENSA